MQDDESEFERDFEEKAEEEPEDPRNNINQHLKEVGRVKKGSRPAQQLDRIEHQAAVMGAKQQALPFPEPQPAKAKAKEMEEMEPLAPNPLRPRLSPNGHHYVVPGGPTSP